MDEVVAVCCKSYVGVQSVCKIRLCDERSIVALAVLSLQPRKVLRAASCSESCFVGEVTFSAREMRNGIPIVRSVILSEKAQLARVRIGHTDARMMNLLSQQQELWRPLHLWFTAASFPHCYTARL